MYHPSHRAIGAAPQASLTVFALARLRRAEGTRRASQMAAPLVEPLALPRSPTVCYDPVGDGEWEFSDHPITRRQSLRQQTVGGSSRMAVSRGTILVILLSVPHQSFDPILKCKPCPCTICKGCHYTIQFMVPPRRYVNSAAHP